MIGGIMATRAERAFVEGIKFQEKMQDWFGILHTFMQGVGQNHSQINHVWEADVMQKEYAQQWQTFETEFKRNKNTVLRLNQEFIELMSALGRFIRRPFQRVDLVSIRDVERLHAWPASAHGSALTIEQVVQHLEKYKKHIESLTPHILYHKRELIQPVKNIHQLVQSRKLDTILDGLIRDVEKWFSQVEIVFQQLKEKLIDIIHHLRL